MNYPVKCNKCNQALYGPVNYCPFCGAASVSVAATSEKQKPDILRAEISSSLIPGEYTPAIREDIRRKGKEIGITEEASDALLLAVLKEKGFSLAEEGVDDQLSVSWYSAEKRKHIEETQQQPEPTTTEAAPPEQPKPGKGIPQVSTPTEQPKSPIPPVPPHPPKPLFLKVVLVLGIVIILAGLFYTKKDSISPPVPKTGQGETKTQPTVEQPKETRRETVEPPKPQVEQNFNQQPAVTPNLNEEREKIRQEAEKEALAKIEAERQRQEQINRQKEIENQRQEQAAKQREIDYYLSDGKRFFENSKYELCIEKMKEVVKRDSNNREAKQYIRMASEKINNIKRQFSNPSFGGSE